MKLSYSLFWLVYLLPSLVGGAFGIINYREKHLILYGAYILLLILGYCFYILGIGRMLIDYKKPFRLSHQVLFLAFLIPALISPFFYWKHIQGNEIKLLYIFYATMMMQTFFYLISLFLEYRYVRGKSPNYKFIFFLPPIIQIISSLIVAAFFLFKFTNNLNILEFVFKISVLLSIVIYTGGFILTFFHSSPSGNKGLFFSIVPIIAYSNLMSYINNRALNIFKGDFYSLYFIFLAELYIFIFVYYFMVMITLHFTGRKKSEKEEIITE
ncbi:MAG: hypothetical protein H7A25_10285 [Leptospiraceae bacterium]|nr:hypothetical protein [Leptospiraceae bacterium]